MWKEGRKYENNQRCFAASNYTPLSLTSGSSLFVRIPWLHWLAVLPVLALLVISLFPQTERQTGNVAHLLLCPYEALLFGLLTSLFVYLQAHV